MIKKIGLTAAVILASAAMAQPAAAANWNNNNDRGRVEQRYDARDNGRNGYNRSQYVGNDRDRDDRDYREVRNDEHFDNRHVAVIRMRRPALRFTFQFGHDRY